jgi:hypothetical protein
LSATCAHSQRNSGEVYGLFTAASWLGDAALADSAKSEPKRLPSFDHITVLQERPLTPDFLKRWLDPFKKSTQKVDPGRTDPESRHRIT